jgi:hypothetical protein
MKYTLVGGRRLRGSRIAHNIFIPLKQKEP